MELKLFVSQEGSQRILLRFYVRCWVQRIIHQAVVREVVAIIAIGMVEAHRRTKRLR